MPTTPVGGGPGGGQLCLHEEMDWAERARPRPHFFPLSMAHGLSGAGGVVQASTGVLAAGQRVPWRLGSSPHPQSERRPPGGGLTANCSGRRLPGALGSGSRRARGRPPASGACLPSLPRVLCAAPQTDIEAGCGLGHPHARSVYTPRPGATPYREPDASQHSLGGSAQGPSPGSGLARRCCFAIHPCTLGPRTGQRKAGQMGGWQVPKRGDVHLWPQRGDRSTCPPASVTLT